MQRLRDLRDAHERLKHRIHNFRIPIRNKYAYYLTVSMYVAVPFVCGLKIMEWTGASERARMANTPEGQARLRELYHLDDEEFLADLQNSKDAPLSAEQAVAIKRGALE
ncbi:hypothetical protein FVE85_9294 [Porphyridium purpureum]|uniref:Uncharacterized protein n=1 Tax=Porphyridium purpureum TaxID=35688 RepID=A0A5J4YQE6_PORPP|nr:hypothetical protein FVE85_9294 [Porphyridium purpureum]|eukprot:POR1138..scf222_8